MENIESIHSLKYHMLIWRLSGSWPINPGNSIISTVYSALIAIPFFIVFPLGITIQLFRINDISEFVQTLVFLLPALIGIKMSLVQSQRKLLRRIFAMMSSLDEQVQTVEYERIRNKGVKEAISVHTVLFITYFTTALFLFMATALGSNRELMWAFWLPFDHRKSALIYYAMLAYQCMATMFVGTVNSSLDSFGSSMYSMLVCHLEILGLRMQSLGEAKHQLTKNDTNLGKTIPVGNKLNRPQELSIEDELKNCVKIHSLIIEFSCNYTRLCDI